MHIHKQIQVSHTIIYVFLYIHKMQMYNILSIGKANMFVTPCFFYGWVSFFFQVVVWGFSKQKVPKFLTRSPKKIPIAHHFYPICFGKYCPLFIYIDGLQGRNSILQNKPFILGIPHLMNRRGE